MAGIDKNKTIITTTTTCPVYFMPFPFGVRVFPDSDGD